VATLFGQPCSHAVIILCYIGLHMCRLVPKQVFTGTYMFTYEYTAEKPEPGRLPLLPVENPGYTLAVTRRRSVRTVDHTVNLLHWEIGVDVFI